VRLATAEERNRLAREIHDTIAQGLAAIALNLESADLLLDNPAKGEKAREKLRKALELTRANLDEARRSVLDLRAAPLQENSLADALETLVVQFGRENGINAQFELGNGTDAARRYPARLETGIYRVAQEALTNVGKHAAARSVVVEFGASLTAGHESLRLVVEDDGRGFDPAVLAEPGHFGVQGMHERARLLKGELHLNSCPGNGTRIELIVPNT
jgi:two-component system, NarL family, sensor kinase